MEGGDDADSGDRCDDAPCRECESLIIACCCCCGVGCGCSAGEKAELVAAVEKALCVLGMLTYWEATVSDEARGVAAIGMGRWMRDGDIVAADVEVRAAG